MEKKSEIIDQCVLGNQYIKDLIEKSEWIDGNEPGYLQWKGNDKQEYLILLSNSEVHKDRYNHDLDKWFNFSNADVVAYQVMDQSKANDEEWTKGDTPSFRSFHRRKSYFVKLSNGDIEKAKWDQIRHSWIKHSTYDVVAFKAVEARKSLEPFGKEWTEDAMSQTKEQLVEYIKQLLKASLARKKRR